MDWKGRRQSTNIEDKTLDPLPQIPEGTPMYNEGGTLWHNGPGKEAARKETNAARDVARRGNNVPTPTPRPSKGPVDNGSHDNLVTPGKWNTKTK